MQQVFKKGHVIQITKEVYSQLVIVVEGQTVHSDVFP